MYSTLSKIETDSKLTRIKDKNCGAYKIPKLYK